MRMCRNKKVHHSPTQGAVLPYISWIWRRHCPRAKDSLKIGVFECQKEAHGVWTDSFMGCYCYGTRKIYTPSVEVGVLGNHWCCISERRPTEVKGWMLGFWSSCNLLVRPGMDSIKSLFIMFSQHSVLTFECLNLENFIKLKEDALSQIFPC